MSDQMDGYGPDDWREAFTDEEEKLSNLQEQPTATWRWIRRGVWALLCGWCVAVGVVGAVIVVAALRWAWRAVSGIMPGGHPW